MSKRKQNPESPQLGRRSLLKGADARTLMANVYGGQGDGDGFR